MTVYQGDWPHSRCSTFNASMPAILLLAAGNSSRLGRPKQLLAYQGKTLLRRAAETAAAAADGSPVIVVTGALHEELLPELAGLPVQVVRCFTWQAGMGASLKTGLGQLEHHQPLAETATVMLCDQPHVTPALLRELASVHGRTSQPIVASAYAQTQGVPVLFSRCLFPQLRALPDAAGAAALLRQHPGLVATVPFPAGAVDVDTEAQYRALLEQ